MEICNNDSCTTCTACRHICPVSAITIEVDAEGFRFPVVNEKICVNCNLCRQICPNNQNKIKTFPSLKFMAVKATREIRERSSSGGVFYVLAKHILDNNGYVCGVVWDMEELKVRHIVSDSYDDMYRMMGSKYMESDLGEVLPKIKGLLDDGKTVLFTGTPCQNAGLKAYLRSDYKNLLLVDVICHGVPSEKVFSKYIKENFTDKQISSCSFRDKSYYRWSESLSLFFDDGSIYRNPTLIDPYMWLFEKGLSLRRSCGDNCLYNSQARCSDITLGDFWSVREWDQKHNIQDEKKLFDTAGVSVVSINTNRGKEYFKSCSLEFEKVERLRMPEAIRHNNYFSPVYYDREERNRFFKLLITKGFNDALYYVQNHKYDIALIGLWNGGNYGAMITARALYEELSKLGYEVIMVDTENGYGQRNDKMLEFITNNCNTTIRYGSKSQISELNKMCDTFLVGSDQCWNPPLNRMYDALFLLDFVYDDHKKISYATSFGFSNIDFEKSDKELYEYYLQKFDYVSVREKQGVEILKDIVPKAFHVIDPIFFLDTEKYTNSTSKTEEVYLLTYILDIKPDTKHILDKVSTELNLENRIILGLDYTNSWECELENVINVDSVDEFIMYFSRAKYVITDSYHGMCLAILFNKPFRVIINEGRGRSRFDSLIDKAGLNDVAIENDNSIFTDYYNFNWEKINANVYAFKKESIDWLKQALLDVHHGKLDFEKKRTFEKIVSLENEIRKLNDEIDQIKNNKEKPLFRRIANYFEMELEDNSNVVIRGAGIHTLVLLDILLPILDKKNIVFYVFDNKPGIIEAMGKIIPVYTPSEKYIRECDATIVSSWRYRDEILSEISDIVSKDNSFTRVYDVYKDLNLNPEKPFYEI